MKTINWYPGHMKKTRELIEANLKLVDVVCEVCDARIPFSSRNPIIDEMAAGKPRILVLNKSDLADRGATNEWLEFFRVKGVGAGAEKGVTQGAEKGAEHSAEKGVGAGALALNAMSGEGVNALLRKLGDIAEKKAASGKAKALIPLRLMIVGIPNSGKSSLINRLTGRRAAQVGNRPGVTRGKQWLTLENGMQLLDTPGILWPKFENQEVGLKLAFCGSIRDEIMDLPDLGLELIRVLAGDYPDLLAERYGLEGLQLRHEAEYGEMEDGDAGLCDASDGGVSTDKALAVMEEIALKRGLILPGRHIDYGRTARTVLDEFRAGKIGRITLERPRPAHAEPGFS